MFRVYCFALHLSGFEDAKLQDTGSHIVEVDVFIEGQVVVLDIIQFVLYLDFQLLQIYLQVEQHFNRLSFTFAQETQKQMFRSYIAVLEADSLFLAIRDDVGNSRCKLVVHAL